MARAAQDGGRSGLKESRMSPKTEAEKSAARPAAGAETARITYGGKSWDLPVVTGSEGEKGLDITSLRKDTGLITFDPGYVNTGACRSAITFIDGENGILR